jgi:hypothetical protein
MAHIKRNLADETGAQPASLADLNLGQAANEETPFAPMVSATPTEQSARTASSSAGQADWRDKFAHLHELFVEANAEDEEESEEEPEPPDSFDVKQGLDEVAPAKKLDREEALAALQKKREALAKRRAAGASEPSDRDGRREKLEARQDRAGMNLGEAMTRTGAAKFVKRKGHVAGPKGKAGGGRAARHAHGDQVAITAAKNKAVANGLATRSEFQSSAKRDGATKPGAEALKHDKQEKALSKQTEALERDSEDYRRWLGHLYLKAGNEDDSCRLLSDKELKRLGPKAKKNNWPGEWNRSLLTELFKR